jgi:hypothetical protein
MANLYAWFSLDMSNDESYLDEDKTSATVATNQHIQFSDGTYTQDFYGTFNYNPYLNSGTVTSMSVAKNGVELYNIIRLNLDVETQLLDDSVTEEELDIAIFAGDDTFSGSNEDDYLESYAGNDVISARDGNDIINAGTGDDTIHGGGGTDTVILSGNASNYTITDNGTALSVSGIDGNDEVSTVERLKFDDKNIAFDINETAGEAYRLYKAAFDRIPDHGGLGFWINALDNGAAMSDVAAGFTNSDEFTSQYGTDLSNSEFINLLYNNVLDRDADQGGLDFWLGHMNSGALTREGVLIEFSESNENQNNVIELIAAGIEYTEWVV